MDNPLPPAVVLPLPPKPHSVGFTYTFEQCKVDGFIKSVDIIENIVTLSEYVFTSTLTATSFNKTQKSRDHFLTFLTHLYPSNPTLKSCSTSLRSQPDPSIRGRDFYSMIDNIKINEILSPLSPNSKLPESNFENPANLVPTLRWYQKKSVEWMLSRESGSGPKSQSWRLLWVPLSPTFHYNPFFKIAVCSLSDALVYLPPSIADEGVREVKGGLLAEQMGLGKTVEVLALVTSHTRDMTKDEEEGETFRVEEGAQKVIVKSEDEGGGEVMVEGGGGRSRAGKTKIKTGGERETSPRTSPPSPRNCLCGVDKKSGRYSRWLTCPCCSQSYHLCCVDRSMKLAKMVPSAHCLTCIAEERKGRKVKSGATLIITPRPLTSQWVEEIKRHTRGLEIGVYDGVKFAGSSSSGEDMLLSNPLILARHDIVLTTFEVLKDDLNHSDYNPYSAASGKRGGRGGKRKVYPILPSPLTSIEWWRVCIDEAQRVSTPTAKSAMMALRLTSVNRWAVTGTPVAKNKLDDIYGLMLFLDQQPWADRTTFRGYFNGNAEDIEGRVKGVFGEVMWRSTKDNEVVKKQLDIPKQMEKVHMLQFQPIEQAVYNKHFSDVQPTVRKLLLTLSEKVPGGGKRKAVRKFDASSVSNLIARLRCCCSHPSVGAHGMKGGKKGKKDKKKEEEEEEEGNDGTMTMVQIAGKLVEDAQEKCREDQSSTVYHLNAEASFYRLVYIYRKTPKLYHRATERGSSRSTLFSSVFSAGLKYIDPPALSTSELNDLLNRSIEVYESVLKIQDSSVSLFKYDPLQRIHALHNLMRVRMEGGFPVNSEEETELDELRTRYLGARAMEWAETRQKLVKEAEAQSEDVAKLDEHNPVSDSPWWSSALDLIISNTSETNRLSETLVPYIESEIANMLIATGGLTFTEVETSGTSKRSASRKNKRQEEVAKQRLEQRNAAGHHDNLNHRFEDAKSLKAEINSYTETFNVVERYCSTGESEDFKQVMALFNPPETSDILRNGNCRVCRSEARKTGPICSHCSLLSLLEKKKSELQDRTFLTILDSVKKFMKSMITGVGVAAGEYIMEIVEREEEGTHKTVTEEVWKRERHGTAQSPLFVVPRESLETLKDLEEEAALFEEVKVQAMKTCEAMVKHHESHQNLMGRHDELSQCVGTARLRLAGETYSSAGLVEQGNQLMMKIAEHEGAHKASLGALEESKRHLKYMVSLMEDEANPGQRAPEESPKQEICMICLDEFDEERAILACGHSFHPPCLTSWIQQGKGGGRGIGQDQEVKCVLRCPRKGKLRDVLFSSTKEAADEAAARVAAKAAAKAQASSKKDDQRAPTPPSEPELSLSPLTLPTRAPLLNSHVIGARNYGTKITKLVDILQYVRDAGEKAVVLSLWDQTLKIIGDALANNGVKCHLAGSGKGKLGDVIDSWKKDSSATALAFNVKNGAEGLTLVEASHIFIVDPLVNTALDHQAISRIHRIGQTKATTVHRFLIKGTVEDVLHAERKERMVALENGEVDLDELKNKEVVGGGGGGGGDSGFSVDELKRIFRVF